MCLPVEPFKVESEFEHAGLKCAVVMNSEAGYRCGYVRVPPTHPFYAASFLDLPVAVHGDLSFGEQEPCEHEDGQGWWFGFDCGHTVTDFAQDPEARLEDMTTDSGRMNVELRDGPFQVLYEHWVHRYWTLEDVESETRMLAEQFAAVVHFLPAP